MNMTTLLAFLTFLLTLTFTLLYFSKGIEKKPAFLAKIIDTLTQHLNQIALWGSGYGVVAIVLTLLTASNPTYTLICLASNILVVLMALPFALDSVADKFRDKINTVVLEEAKSLAGWVTGHEKYVSYVGMVCSVLLFTIVFH